MVVTHSVAKCASLKPIFVLVERDEEAEVAITSVSQEYFSWLNVKLYFRDKLARRQRIHGLIAGDET